MRALRRTALVTGGLLVLAWLLPALVVRLGFSELSLARDGRTLELALEGVRPGWPWGVHIAKIHTRSGQREIELENAHTSLTTGGLRLLADIEHGTLLVETSLDGTRGFARIDDFPIDKLPVELPPSLELRGTADGELRWQEKIEIEAWIDHGTLRLAGGAISLDFRRLTLTAAQGQPDVWDVALVELEGPPLSLRGSGRIGPRGRLALTLAVHHVEEPARTYLGLLGVRNTPPFDLIIAGSLRRPRVRAAP